MPPEPALSGQRRATLASLGLTGAPNPEFGVAGIAASSQAAAPGFLFAALPGTNAHGAEFATDAVERGASAILTDAAGKRIAAKTFIGSGVQLIEVEEPRAALSRAAALWFGAAPETVVAVTGTNGKTSVVSMCRQIWHRLGRHASSSGTLGIEGAFSARLAHTTPDPITLHRRLAEMAAADVTHVAMEASSHGLAQNRLDGVALTAAAFTNLTHDHLDYHESEDAYFAAKAGIFDRVLPPDGTAVICVNGSRGREMADVAFRRGQRVITVGGAGSDIELKAQQLTGSGQLLRFSWNGRRHQVALALIGGFQAWNILTAAGLTIAAGEDSEAVFSVLDRIGAARGRLQLAARRRNGAVVFVDYAHTPDALQASLTSLRQHFVGNLVVLFGAGGDRDRQKRPVMGQVASRHADAVIVTDDNPRTEDPADIRSQIMSRCPDAVEIGDRAEAIVRGVELLGPGDVLLVAGKGHESGQEVAGAIHPFDDLEQASIAVNALDGSGA